MLDITVLEKFLDEANSISLTKYVPDSFISVPTLVDSNKFNKWQTKLLNYLELNCESSDIHLKRMKEEVNTPTLHELEKGISILESLIESIEEGLYDQVPNMSYDFKNLENIFYKFHRIAQKLSKRSHNRPPLLIKDEYDVQYLLHALLKLYFNDIRPEDYVPSYAGGKSRVDFFINDIGVIIETKMTSPTLRDKKIGEQLIIDIERYSKHSDFKKLYCFVYDPDNYINNPDGLEQDLNKSEEFEVKVIIVPKF